MNDDEDYEEGGCGWEWDHDGELISDDEGSRQYVCRECGAEWFEEDDA